MDKFKFIEHTADVLFKASGTTFNEALTNAGYALLETIGKSKTSKTKVTIEIDTDSVEDLVVLFLSDIIYEMDSRQLTFNKIEIINVNLKENIVKAILYGDETRPKDSVKAVTYHMLDINHDAEGWTIQVLLDV